MPAKIPHKNAAIDWLIRDQYDHGEWGKCEIKDRTALVRTQEESRQKPNLFTSSLAAYGLIASDGARGFQIQKFFKWVNALRDVDGWWTSASGSRVPFGQKRGWSEVRNLRHTMRGLDLLYLFNEDRAQDALLCYEVVSAQLSSGAYTHSSGSYGDIWATAYAMNLLIRMLQPEIVNRTCPRGTSHTEWETKLRTRLDKARSWICEQRRPDGLWHLEGEEAAWVSFGLVVQLGGDFSLNRPDICRSLATALLALNQREEATSLWALFLLWPEMDADQQRIIIGRAKKLGGNYYTASDTLEASCYLRLACADFDPERVTFFVQDARGHESTLRAPISWLLEDYANWCVRSALKLKASGNGKLAVAPRTKAEAWLSVGSLLETYRQQVENSRGWELLWESAGRPRQENAVQIAFWQVAKPLVESMGMRVTREVETGRGPVDFEFTNGVGISVLVEFKLASNSGLLNSAGSQLRQYMTAHSVDSAFIVCIGYEEGAAARFAALEKAVTHLRQANPGLYIEALFIDARQRKGASHAKAQ